MFKSSTAMMDMREQGRNGREQCICTLRTNSFITVTLIHYSDVQQGTVLSTARSPTWTISFSVRPAFPTTAPTRSSGTATMMVVKAAGCAGRTGGDCRTKKDKPETENQRNFVDMVDFVEGTTNR